MKFICLFSFVILYSVNSISAEIDNVTVRNYPINDSAAFVNHLIQQEIQRSVNAVEGCDQEALKEYLRFNLNTNWGNVRDIVNGSLVGYVSASGDNRTWDLTETKKFSELPEEVAKFTLPNQPENPELLYIPHERSIFARAPRTMLQNIAEKFKVGFGAKVLNVLDTMTDKKLKEMVKETNCCDLVINLCGTKMGTDKLDHMLGHGYIYYSGTKQGLSEAEVNQFGEWRERSRWGLGSTGVKSYGDLVANYQGMTFWQKLLDESPKVISCVEGKYVVNTDLLKQRLDICSFVDAGFDESINCSSYFSKEMAISVQSQIADRSLGHSCPLEPQKCKSLTEKYSKITVQGGKTDLSKLVLHPNCRNPGSSFDSVEEDISTQYPHILSWVPEYEPTLRRPENPRNKTDDTQGAN